MVRRWRTWLLAGVMIVSLVAAVSARRIRRSVAPSWLAALPFLTLVPEPVAGVERFGQLLVRGDRSRFQADNVPECSETSTRQRARTNSGLRQIGVERYGQVVDASCPCHVCQAEAHRRGDPGDGPVKFRF